MEWKLRSADPQGAHETGGCAQGERARPHPRGQGAGPLVFIFCEDFLYFPKSASKDFQDIPRTFAFYT